MDPKISINDALQFLLTAIVLALKPSLPPEARTSFGDVIAGDTQARMAWIAENNSNTTFLLIKRLLDLAYLWVGGLNGIRLQVWATFLFYAILIDLCDDVAELLQVPLEAISVEMVYRSLYFYVQAVEQGDVGGAAAYLAQEAKGLGIIKRCRPGAGPAVSDQIRRALVAPALALGP